MQERPFPQPAFFNRHAPEANVAHVHRRKLALLPAVPFGKPTKKLETVMLISPFPFQNRVPSDVQIKETKCAERGMKGVPMRKVLMNAKKQIAGFGQRA